MLTCHTEFKTAILLSSSVAPHGNMPGRMVISFRVSPTITAQARLQPGTPLGHC